LGASSFGIDATGVLFALASCTALALASSQN
jgi:hypothetical protein